MSWFGAAVTTRRWHNRSVGVAFRKVERFRILSPPISGKNLGKGKEFLVNVHATYAVTRKAAGTKMGQGKVEHQTLIENVSAHLVHRIRPGSFHYARIVVLYRSPPAQGE